MYNPTLLNKPKLKSRRIKLRKRSTDAERKLWSKLRARQLDGFKFYRQFSAGPYILDFYCPACRLAVELDGGQHTEEMKILYDEKRTEYLNKNNIRVMRFWDDDVLNNIEGVSIEISKNLTPPTPLKIRGGEKINGILCDFNYFFHFRCFFGLEISHAAV